MPDDKQKGYIALLGWSLNAIEAAAKFEGGEADQVSAEELQEVKDYLYRSWGADRCSSESPLQATDN
ncbi:hypothetical protein [Marinospirillum perlucidum]|uniref:hypothetical protein n=1 Tax=Marinospirillum perlucidum TaxID=1982602 RepID=UPI000DF3A69D|nr:hypothetical protein [Marinospirillum perlucidum]